MITSNSFHKELVERALSIEIKQEIDKLIEAQARIASQRVIEQVNKMADSIALRLLSQYSVSELSDRIVIEVRKLEVKP